MPAISCVPCIPQILYILLASGKMSATSECLSDSLAKSRNSFLELAFFFFCFWKALVDG